MTATTTPGWHQDPWRQAAYRWWDGSAWTAHTHGASAPHPQAARSKPPKLPAWLSWPVLLCALPALFDVALAGANRPVALVGALVPVVWVLPVLWWLDRLEPEPASARIHALLWGAVVATTVALAANSVAGFVGGPVLAAVVSAPFFEEIGKGLAIVIALRRRQVDSVSDGLVYAGWAGLGFAVVENVGYLASTPNDAALVGVLVSRTVLTPFAHPLMTAWTGLAIGLTVRKGRPLRTAWWGLAMAMLTHAVWNGAIALAERQTDPANSNTILVITSSTFFLLFLLSGVMLIAVRREEAAHLREVLPHLVERYRLSDMERQLFSSHRSVLAARRRLPRSQRRIFDTAHSSLVRLSELWRRPNALGTEDEARLAHNLREARAELNLAQPSGAWDGQTIGRPGGLQT